MKNVLRDLASRQLGVVARWQLVAEGWSPKMVEHRTAGLRRLHDGVYLTGDAPPTRIQLWWAATLTSPDSVLGFASAGAAYGFRPWQASFEVVTRPGTGGPKRHGALLVCRARAINVATLHGMRITTPEQTIADLWRHLDARAQTKMLREALRLESTTVPLLEKHLAAAPPRNRPATLIRLIRRFERLQLHRCRSDAEAYAVELLDEARIQPPDVNHRRAGEEADLSWPGRRLIVEIDGDQFHQDKAHDARKTRTWRAAGWRVERVPSGVVFERPSEFTASVRAWLAQAAARSRAPGTAARGGV